MAFLNPLEQQEQVLTLEEKARKKILAKTQSLHRSLVEELYHSRPP
jgi:hypothetical protein